MDADLSPTPVPKRFASSTPFQAGVDISQVSSSSPGSVSTTNVHFLSLPPEIHINILFMVDPVDVVAYSSTCRRCYENADNNHLWKYQWVKLSKKTPFTFPPVQTMVDIGVNFKDSCKRIWKILVTEGAFGGLVPTRCSDCKEYTCTNMCVEDKPRKVSMDIGGKITWVINTNFSLKRHLSMIAVPKFLKCYDCDTTLDRNEMQCDCVPSPQDSSILRSRVREAYCHNRLMSSRTALEYCSQPLGNLRWGQPFCLFCDEDRVNRLHCEREMVSNTKRKMKSVRPPYMKIDEEEFLNYSVVSPLANGYCRDTADILGANNLDLLAPLLALEHEDTFPVVKSFLSHLLKQFKLINDLQKPNCSFVLTYAKLPMVVQELVLNYLFEEVKIAKVCLLPKALAVSYLFDVKTCIVVDSGATCTYVWIVLDGKVDEDRTQSVSVGGWHVSQFLKQSLLWKDKKQAEGATVSSLDTSTVKQKCRLSLNISRENCDRNIEGGAVGGQSAETLHIKSQRDAAHNSKLELTEVTLSSELFLAPEMMYVSLDLPCMIKEATRDLPGFLVKDCFSNILLTGGNTDLQGFCHRLSSDLRELLPEYSPIINVCPYPTGNHSWNSVMGANKIRVTPTYDDLMHVRQPGTPMWMSREEYIIYGSLQFCSDMTREG